MVSWLAMHSKPVHGAALFQPFESNPSFAVTCDGGVFILVTSRCASDWTELSLAKRTAMAVGLADL